MLVDGKIFLGVSERPEYLNLKYANRHGLITGATGTGKTVSLQVLAEGFSAAGVPVFAADIKGDVSGVARMGQIFAEHKKLNAGDNFMIDWVPGVGTVITVKGLQQGEPFKEPEFFNALLRIWLGPNPADWKLKDALLGKPA